MHIPDNYLSPATCAVMGAAMLPVWALAVKKVKKEITRERLPLLGIGAAFSFLIMMFNVPLPGGTSGHAVGGTLIAALLGPWAATIAISIALLLQALLFGDGGVLSYGANCFNMAFVIPFAGYFIYKTIKDRVKSNAGELVGLGLGSYVGINLAALCAAIEFGLQPLVAHDAQGLPLYCPYPLSVSVPAMTIPHLAVAGVVEILFTVAIFAFVKRTAPETIRTDASPKTKPLFILVFTLVCLSPIGLLASGTAWGEWGKDEIASVNSSGSALGFVPAGMRSGFNLRTLMPDYSLSGLPEIAGYLIAAFAGVAILVIAFKLLSVLLSRNSGKKTES